MDSDEYGEEEERVLEEEAGKTSDLEEVCVWPSNFRDPADLELAERSVSCVGVIEESVGVTLEVA